jgi:hypothetical protein
MASRSVTAVFYNRTSDTILQCVQASVPHGDWDTSLPGVLAPGVVAAWTTQSNGLFTGTQGSATFEASLTPSNPAQIAGDWSLSVELVSLEPYLPAGFQASDGIKMLFPHGYSGSITNLWSFVSQSLGSLSIALNWDNPYAGSGIARHPGSSRRTPTGSGSRSLAPAPRSSAIAA